MSHRYSDTRWLVLSDIHVPYHFEPLMAAALELARDVKFDGCILNGDVLDLIEITHHNAGSVKALEGKRIAHTFAAGNRLLDRLDDALPPKAEKFFLAGNHEDRWDRWIASGDNAVWADDEVNSIPGRLHLEDRGWEWRGNYPEAHVMLGKLLVTHGQWAGMHCAKKHLDEYQTSCLVGHTHTDQTHHASTWEGQRVCHCAGYMGDPTKESFDYKKRPRRWVQGFTVVTVARDGAFWIQPIRWWDGKFVFGAQTYPKKARRK